MTWILIDLILRPFRHPRLPGKLYTPATAPGSPDPAIAAAAPAPATEEAPLAAIECAISTCAAHPRSDTFCIFCLKKCSLLLYCK